MMGKCEWPYGPRCFKVATQAVTVTRDDLTDAGTALTMTVVRNECVNHAAAEMLRGFDTYVEPLGGSVDATAPELF